MKYEIKNYRCDTLCPFRDDELMVGSNSCTHCPHFIAQNAGLGLLFCFEQSAEQLTEGTGI